MNRNSETIWRSGSEAGGIPPVRRGRLKGGRWAPALFLAPSAAGLLLFFLLPFADTVRRSMTDARGSAFIGGESYA